MTRKPPADAIERVYLFSGEADSRRSAAVNKLVGRMVDPDWGAFDLEKFDGDAASAEDILTAAATLPAGSERKVVIVNRADRLSADAQERIAAFIPKLGPKSCLILLGGEGGGSKRKSGGKDKAQDDDDVPKSGKGLRPSLVSAAKAGGTVINFVKLRSQDLGAMVMEAVRAQGKKIEPAAAQTLARSVESSPAALESEVEKLATYIGDRETITQADIGSVVPKSPEDRIFPLIDAVAGGQPGAAVQMLEETLAASARPESEVLRMVSMLARHFRLLYQMKFLAMHQGRGEPAEDLRSMLMREPNPLSVSDWQRNKLMAQARLFTLGELRDCLKQVLSCELAAKGQSPEAGPPRLNLEMLVLRLSQRRAASSAGARA